MDSASDGLVDPTSSFVPAEALVLFQQIGTVVVLIASALVAFLVTRKLFFYLTWRSFRDGAYVIGYHQWRPGNLAGPHWCNICESIVYGIRSYVVTCDICGMFAHAQCAATTIKPRSSITSTSPRSPSKDADLNGSTSAMALAAPPPPPPPTALEERCACKMAAVHAHRTDYQQPHLWVKGNIDPMDTCSICGLFCGSLLALSGLKCAWCHMRVHENCFHAAVLHQQHHPHHKHQLGQFCDFGRHANLILPPSSVILKQDNDATTPSIASKSQRALSSVRTAAQIAVHKMATIRLRRPSALTKSSRQNSTSVDGAASGASDPSTAPSTPNTSPRTSRASSSSTHENMGLLNDHGDSPSPSPSPSKQNSESELLAPLPVTISTSNLTSSSTTTLLSTSTTTVVTLPFDIVASPQDKSPLLVFINSRSGGQMGLHVLRQIRRWLNPIQIYDLSHGSPIAALLQFKDIPRLRILVCGGDGTIGWVLGALDEIGASRQPPIAVLPLGTGNDLARVLGWGSGFSTKDVSDILAEVEAAHVSLLDRWRVEIDGKKRAVLNNYLGVGVDAQVALEFHEQRERSPGLFVSQFVNKLWYSQFGAKNFLVRTCAGLPSKMTLECDGKQILLPEGTEGVIVLNINSYGGGSTLWHEDSDSDSESDSDCDDSDAVSASETDDGSLSDGDGSGSTSSCSRFNGPRQQGRRGGKPRVGSSSPHDGLLDVVAVYGTLHLGQMQVGLSKAVRLCQAKKVKIHLKEKLPVQIDGEPWLQDPCDVDISFHQQAFMLSRTVQEKDFVTRRVGEVLDWAETTGVISSSQRDVLLAEIARRVADHETIATSTARHLGAAASSMSSTISSSSMSSSSLISRRRRGSSHLSLLSPER